MKRLIAGVLSAVALIGLAQVAMGQSGTSSSAAPVTIQLSEQNRQALSANTVLPSSPVQELSKRQPWEMGVLAQGGVGLTQSRDGFKFLMAGVHLGKVMTPVLGHGYFRGQFEYAGEFFPFWQSYTPKFQRANCIPANNLVGFTCSNYFTTGGTYTGTSLTPIILRWNYTRGKRFMPWVQGAGGILWTNHKYPAFGSPTLGLSQDGPNTEASVFNFTPQGGVGFHYFLRPKRSVDFSANGIHISSASLGDKNPGVNASVQFSLGYTWWK
jgi:hypothetical protein